MSVVGVIIFLRAVQRGSEPSPKVQTGASNFFNITNSYLLGGGDPVSLSSSISSFLVAEASLFSSREMTKPSPAATTFVVEPFFLPTQLDLNLIRIRFLGPPPYVTHDALGADVNGFPSAQGRYSASFLSAYSSFFYCSRTGGFSGWCRFFNILYSLDNGKYMYLLQVTYIGTHLRT